ncbi:hypothetical protein JDN40_03240 [Rhodomicrobium vannielii ATCC 17100]|uniref:SctD/MshK family protein n=1 Tax=Rhodomicrobium vannielii TaxID=1069 RepID=UPI0019193275|nr:hypothetical protein [Rhodomicrobium vannielii]MBJ7533128.1 hypothetical protein [Rhodomicrobium vannielii ATCC 17100]
MTAAVFRVLSGRHAGASGAMPSTEISVGSAIGSDLVLTDDTVAPVEVRLVAGRFFIEVEAVGPNVAIGGRAVGVGQRTKTVYPARLSFGGVEIECVGDGRPFGLGMPAIMSIGVGILIAASAIQIWHGSARPALDGSQGKHASAVQVAYARPDSSAVQEATVALHQHLQSAGFHGVDVVAGDGAVVARGIVRQNALEAWRATQLWFDSTYGQRVTLQSEVTIAAPKAQIAPIGIQAVWAGSRPYLIDDHGDKYFEGAFLKDGWIVEKIEDRRVTLRKNHDVITLEL